MDDLWDLVWGKPEIDPCLLSEAVERAAAVPDLDFRTRVLIRDSVLALEQHWGPARMHTWLKRSPASSRIAAIRSEDLGEPGFPFLKETLMDPTESQSVRQYLRELGTHLHRPVRMDIGGSIALILPGYLSRSTGDIAVVDEVPPEVRSQRALLDQLAQRYGLLLTHFQSHFLPSGWQTRVHSLEPFGNLQVSLVDVYDVFLGKLFSNRRKDLDDCRLLLPGLDRETLVTRFRDTTGAFQREETLRQSAARNWYILTGEALPTS
jgi:hypothetical protein